MTLQVCFPSEPRRREGRRTAACIRWWFQKRQPLVSMSLWLADEFEISYVSGYPSDLMPHNYGLFNGDEIMKIKNCETMK